MAASKPTSWLSMYIHFLALHLILLWDLNDWSGLFPSRQWTFAPIVCLHYFSFFLVFYSIRSLVEVCKIFDSLAHPVLYPYITFHNVLYINRFRRKPAITKFDWSFAPNHKSSKSFTTPTSSILRSLLHKLQSAHG